MYNKFCQHYSLSVCHRDIGLDLDPICAIMPSQDYLYMIKYSPRRSKESFQEKFCSICSQSLCDIRKNLLENSKLSNTSDAVIDDLVSLDDSHNNCNKCDGPNNLDDASDDLRKDTNTDVLWSWGTNKAGQLGPSPITYYDIPDDFDIRKIFGTICDDKDYTKILFFQALIYKVGDDYKAYIFFDDRQSVGLKMPAFPRFVLKINVCGEIFDYSVVYPNKYSKKIQNKMNEYTDTETYSFIICLSNKLTGMDDATNHVKAIFGKIAKHIFAMD